MKSRKITRSHDVQELVHIFMVLSRINLCQGLERMVHKDIEARKHRGNISNIVVKTYYLPKLLGKVSGEKK